MVPAILWLDELSDKIRAKCYVRIEQLQEHGYALHRPAAEYLGGGVYELRIRFRSVNYRLLYFFHGRSLIVITHGFTKEQKVPPKEISYAAKCKERFENSPDKHTFEE